MNLLVFRIGRKDTGAYENLIKVVCSQYVLTKSYVLWKFHTPQKRNMEGETSAGFSDHILLFFLTLSIVG